MNFFPTCLQIIIHTLVSKLLGYYGTHWRGGNRLPFLLGTGFVAGTTFVCLFVVCHEGGVTHITWQSVFFYNAGGLHGTNISFLANQPDHLVTSPVRLPNPGYTGSGGGPESWWTSLFQFVILLFLDPVSGSAIQYVHI